MAVRTWPVAVSRAVIVAPSMNAPLWSVTVPLMLARPSCAWSEMPGTRTQIVKQRKKHRVADGIKLAWFMRFSLQEGTRNGAWSRSPLVRFCYISRFGQPCQQISGMNSENMVLGSSVRGESHEDPGRTVVRNSFRIWQHPFEGLAEGCGV